MDVLHPRLLVVRFAECFRFYEAVLPKLIGAHLVKGTEDGPYANWDRGEDGALILFDRDTMAAIIGIADLPRRSARRKTPRCSSAGWTRSMRLSPSAWGTAPRSWPEPRTGRGGDLGCAPRTCATRWNLIELQSY